jgi:hypothetical protein
MTKAQQVYERVEALVAGGTAKADAFKRLAAEFGQPVGSLRGAYYAHAKAIKGGEDEPAPRPRRRETTPADAVESPKQTLLRAIKSIDREVEAARERAEEAQAEYEALKDSAEARKAAIQAKVEALEA